MNGQRFDDLAKAFATGLSRREVLKNLAGGVVGAALSLIGGRAMAAPNRCAQGCAFEPQGPRAAACRQACKQCGGDFTRVCFGIEIICCPPETSCCLTPSGDAICCPEGTVCCEGTCCPETTLCAAGECIEPVDCGTADCASNPCGFDPLSFCGKTATGDLCVCSEMVSGCTCVQPICGIDVCTTDEDCPAGFVCISANADCCGIGQICAPLCDTVLTASAVEGTHRWN